MHSSYSMDAFISGNRNDPWDAYRFARGETIVLANGSEQRLSVPLDFTAVTDHAEMLAGYNYCTDDSSPIFKSDYCTKARANDSSAFSQILEALLQTPPQRVGALQTSGLRPREAAKGPWRGIQEAADEFYEPGVFTTFIGFEFSPLLPDFGMLHRNVLFRNSQVPPEALGAQDLVTAERLWVWLDEVCSGDCEALAIPHNSNYSWGQAFRAGNTDGTPLTTEVLYQRARLEPLVEILQAKGNSECAPGVGTTDEECGFEQLFPKCEERQTTLCARFGSMVRDGLKTGLTIEAQFGVNPFKYGIIASTDTHNGNPGATQEDDFRGHASYDDDTPKKRIDLTRLNDPATPLLYNGGGLAGVWAEANTRDALFDAMKRKEAFATSGTRIQVRFFAGWDYPLNLDSRVDMLQSAYQDGVPMGSDLPIRAGGDAPRFLVWAMKDHNGANLNRLQIIKGWRDPDGELREQIYDAVCSDGQPPATTTHHCPSIAPPAEVADCSVLGRDGAAQLSTIWVDPDFDPTKPAFYYTRVLESPTCRWSTHDALLLNLTVPHVLPTTIQERAWSSPIWYRPEGPE